MRLTSVHIENFRGLKDVSFELPTSATVIVGPNAIGKTSILEAIRLTKSILAPTYNGEGQQVLTSLGSFSPALNTAKLDTLVGDAASPLRVTLSIELTTEDVKLLGEHRPQIARRRINNLLGVTTNDDLALVQYLSSPEGQKRYEDALKEITASVDELERSPSINLSLEIDPGTGNVQGGDIFHQEVAQTIIGSQPPALGALTYFPADRAMPSGEVPIQIGSNDAAAQLYSHIGQPATKYQRLKQQLVNQSFTDAAQDMRADFAIVFERLLAGKELMGLELTAEGMLTVRIREPETNATYDIDSMSSGEKGLLLTFFLMRRSTAPGGIVLLDEPELHLNSAVTRKIMPFLIEEVIDPWKIQAIICTHSAEMTGYAYEDDRCTLLRLRSNTDISPIRPQDKSEVYDALKQLGSEPSDVLFSRGAIYVEGEHDVEILTAGWPDRIAGYKVAELHGRSEVEKEIKTFQAAELEGNLDAPQYFIFDHDRKPTGLTSTERVKVRQWDRYCLENYLLDAPAIYDVSKANGFKNILSLGTLPHVLRDISLAQLKQVIAREVYRDLEPDNPGYRGDVDKQSDYSEMGSILVERLASIKAQLADLDTSEWVRDFEAQCNALHLKREAEWRNDWSKLANGKLVLHEVFKRLEPTINFLNFKRQIAAEMKTNRTANWQKVDSVLSSALQE